MAKQFFTKWRFFYNYEKETVWLNKMAQEGYLLVDYWWTRYTFEKGIPGSYVYALEFLEHMHTHPESQQYIAFLEEMGVEVVGRYMHWISVRKKTEDGPLELYTDTASQIEKLNRISKWWISFSILEFSIGLFELMLSIFTAISGETHSVFPFTTFVLLTFFGFVFLLQAIPLLYKKKQLQAKSNIYEK
ncbi:DUF2812 domain-containing protein [Anaeromicropila populeti]|uniref:DUF2812 domain-containing protein n=1 Tax=Anaeromicropila populeti TaxID=37658 RepID=A0A1I6HUD4_9FIRM|nr:DUF2812 domain-containing protein [Anaeromicropila populeti]SFR58072.1 Protein of unknown function [Anaeromicropila populeti]